MPTEEIDKFKRMRTKTDKVIATTKLHSREAYDSAINEHLMDEDGLLDYEKMEDEDVAVAVGEHAANKLQKYARKHFRSGISEEADLENEMLMQAYTGITKAQIVDDARKAGKNYTFDQYKRSIDEATERIERQMSALSASHIKKEHIGDIVKYVKADAFVDKEKMRRDDAVALLETYHRNKTIPPDAVRKEVYAKKEYYKKEAADNKKS